jgi:ABC-type metal ion transport system substrate-binding protein
VRLAESETRSKIPVCETRKNESRHLSFLRVPENLAKILVLKANLDFRQNLTKRDFRVNPNNIAELEVDARLFHG